MRQECQKLVRSMHEGPRASVLKLQTAELHGQDRNCWCMPLALLPEFYSPFATELSLSKLDEGDKAECNAPIPHLAPGDRPHQDTLPNSSAQ